MDAFNSFGDVCLLLLCGCWMIIVCVRLGAIRNRLEEIRVLLKSANVHHDITSTSTDRLADFFHGRNVQVKRDGQE